MKRKKLFARSRCWNLSTNVEQYCHDSLPPSLLVYCERTTPMLPNAKIPISRIFRTLYILIIICSHYYPSPQAEEPALDLDSFPHFNLAQSQLPLHQQQNMSSP